MKNSKYFALFAAAFAFVVGLTGCKVESEKHEHTFSKEWTSDEIAHWHTATCEHKTETSGMATHKFGEWKITREATETQEGEKQRTCSVCKYVEKEIIAKLEHVHTFGSLTVKKEATELEDGYGERTCSACGYVERVTIYALNHTHKFAIEWTSDETEHWHIAICGHTEVSNKEEHKWVKEEIIKPATCTEDGEKKLVCSVCDRTKTEVIPAKGHSFSEEWKSDATYHWHVATCEHSTEIDGKAKHSWGDWKDVQATPDSSQQEQYRICDVCSYKVEEAVSNILENLVKVDGITITGDKKWTPTSGVLKEGLIIPSLYVSDHEITMSEYKKVMGISIVTDNNGNPIDNADDFPVTYVSWFEAIVFCNKLSEKEHLEPCYKINDSTYTTEWGAIPTKETGTDSDIFKSWNNCICDSTKSGYRLPTEAEWEYLARGGQNFKYSGSDTLNDVGWCAENSDKKLNKGKQKNANGYNLYDMSGNVEELCWDLGYFSSSTEPYSRACRGGSFRDANRDMFGETSSCSVNFRGYTSYPHTKSAYRGFRVVRPVTE